MSDKETLENSQADLFSRLTRIADFAKTAKSSQLSQFEAKLERVNKLESEIKDLNAEIIAYNSSLNDDKNKIKSCIDNFDDLFDVITCKYIDLKKSTNSTSTQVPVHQSGDSNLLPKIQLPKFGGNIDEWNNWQSLYKSLVHDNNSIPVIQKFHYLRSHLTNEPLALISNYVLNDLNYQAAYNEILERYTNPRRLLNFYTGLIKNYKPVQSKESLSRFLSTHVNAVKALKALDLQGADLADSLLFQACYDNLNKSDKFAFDSNHDFKNIHSTESLFEFLKQRAQTNELQLDLHEEEIKETKNKKFDSKSYSKHSFFNKNEEHAKSEKGLNTNFMCSVCNSTNNHRIYSCSKFLQLSSTDRRNIISKLNKCLQCLSHSNKKACTSENVCRLCSNKNHHTLLCDKNEQQCNFTNSPSTSISTSTSSKQTTVLLGTARASVQDIYGKWVPIRILIDSGSQLSIVTESLVQKLCLNRLQEHKTIVGLSTNSSKSKGSVILTIRPNGGISHILLNVNASIVSNICEKMPSTLVVDETKSQFQNFILADAKYYSPDKIDLLLGADFYSDIIRSPQSTEHIGSFIMINTIFGQVLIGKAPIDSSSNFSSSSNSSLFSYTSLCLSESQSLDEQMKKFWETEEIQITKPKKQEDIFCEEHFKATHSRTAEGAYEVSLPFRPNHKQFISNRSVVFKKYLKLENRLSKNKIHEKMYNDFLAEYANLNHMSKTSSSSLVMLPHSFVTRESNTTPLRVVFDGSFPDQKGHSLNSRLLSGPKLQLDLAQIMTRFRSYEITLSTDICKMYRYIILSPEHRQYQHIFWRPPGSMEVQEWELNTVTYGLRPSSFLAIRTLHQLVQDEGDSYPLASDAIMHQTCVDDIICGADSIENAKQLQKELITLLSKGGFSLKKWTSNSPEILSEIDKNNCEKPIIFSDGTEGFKILGLKWSPVEDSFSYQVEPFVGSITKRKVLSYIFSLYDPMGLIGPVILLAKSFMQKLWLHNLSWDEPFPESLEKEWKAFASDLTSLSSLRIPRKLSFQSAEFCLLGFGDGSTTGMGCAVYLHALLPDGTVKCHLLRSKSKVFPLKPLTIPRAEIVASVMLVKLVKVMLTDGLPYNFKQIIYFTDSTIVLGWISTPPHQLQTFVANRVVQILELSTPSQWRHISSKDNAADPVSRGLLPSQILNNSVWWHGPTIIHQSIANFPSEDFTSMEKDKLPEIKKKNLVLVNTEDTSFISFFDRYSSFLKLQRIMAYVLRFISNIQSKKCKQNVIRGVLTVEELNNALITALRLIQDHYFREEIQKIKSNQNLQRSLQKLSPFISDDGILRVGGRLSNSCLNFAAKHPILLPQKAHMSRLICDHYHILSCHGGPNAVQALIQQKYWILSLRSLLRKQIFSCIKCFRLKSKPQQPIMADLPAPRTTISRCFAHTGTDFAGPFNVKESNRRNSKVDKGYLCIFTCLATRAVHLEMLTSLSTEAFLACLDRFISRRGIICVLYSDNGRNYVGASKELKLAFKWMSRNNDSLFSALSNRQITWKFAPPTGSNFGGVYESCIKIAKNHLYRVIGNNILTFEEYSTVFARIEAAMNSRPLCQLSPSPEENINYLSPGHFLVGGPLLSAPEQVFSEEISLKSRWDRVRQITHSFWRRWSKEYLHSLIQRHKWTEKANSLKIGQIVLVTGINTSPLSWPLGKIISIFPGSDNVVRVVEVKTSNGSFIRPANKLIAVPSM